MTVRFDFELCRFSFYLKLKNIEIIFDIYFPLQWREDYENRYSNEQQCSKQH